MAIHSWLASKAPCALGPACREGSFRPTPLEGRETAAHHTSLSHLHSSPYQEKLRKQVYLGQLGCCGNSGIKESLALSCTSPARGRLLSHNLTR